MKEEINAIINFMLDADEKEQEEVLRSALEKLKSNPVDMANPEHFYTMFMFPIEDASIILAKNLYGDPADKKNSFKLDFLYTNYGFLSSHIEKLITSRCGSSCVCDCSRHILKIYKRFLLEGIIPEDDFSKDHYWYPKFGSYKEWISYCDSLYGLYYGSLNEYLTSYNVLLKAEIRKYQHILHKWFLKWKDGNEYFFSETYDDDDKNPLNNAFFSDEEFYLINKCFLPESEYETAKEKMLPLRLKVPKKDVLGVRCISETIYI